MVPFNWQLIFDGDRDVHWSVKNLSYDRNLTKRRIYTNHCYFNNETIISSISNFMI